MIDVRENVVALTYTAEVRGAVHGTHSTGRDITFCGDEQALVRVTRRTGPQWIVWELIAGSDQAIESLAAALLESGAGSRLFLIVDLTRSGTRQITRIARYVPYASVALRGHDDLSISMARWFAEPAVSSALRACVERLRPSRPDSVSDILLASTLVGTRRTTAVEFARVCGLPLRTLELKLKIARLPPPSRLLGFAVTLHTAWRLDVLGWRTSEAASAAGFPTVKALSNHVARHAGLRVRDLTEQGAFNAVLDKVASAVDARR